MGHDMVAVPRQVLEETLRNGVLENEAHNLSASQRPSLESARQRDPPEPAMDEQSDSAQRPEQQNVATRQVVADPPDKDAGGENQKCPAPGAQHASHLVDHDDQASGAVEFLHSHRGDEKNRDEHGRRHRVRKLAFKLRRDIVVEHLGAHRAGDNQRKVDPQRCHGDSAVGE